MKSSKALVAIAVFMAGAGNFGAAYAQYGYPSISDRYGNDNPYSRWRATGQWEALPTFDMQGNSQLPIVAPVAPAKNAGGKPAKQDGYGEPLKPAFGAAPK